MSLLAYPLAAMAGGLVGTVAHESLHALIAAIVGRVEAVGWQGGLGGGPYVDFETAGRWRSEAVRKAPLAVGLVAGIVVASRFEPTPSWVAALGVVWGLLWTSPEDLFADAAEQPDSTEVNA
jgi:hypothetical protein